VGIRALWGLDPDWTLTERQRKLRQELIDLCEQEFRANAKVSDDELRYPRRNLELLGSHGFLALTVPEEYGGLGEDHVGFSMVCETIARYGCASTAMCYVMHMGAVNAIMLRHAGPGRQVHPAVELRQDRNAVLLRPETGSHFWYPISPGARRTDDGYLVRKRASWTTSAGFAYFYVVQTTSPDFTGYDDLSVFVVDSSDAQAGPNCGTRSDCGVTSPDR
jgi:alkylation response protein AidB-like acyl-CoA dehydrogenase